MTKLKRIKQLMKSGKWFLRTSNNGLSYNGFKRKRIGVWNNAGKAWTGIPTCNECGGFFGIDKSEHILGLFSGRPTVELCEWRGKRVVIDEIKICVSSYRVIAINKDIPVEAFELCDYRYLRHGDMLDCGIAVCFDGTVIQRGGICRCYGNIVEQDGGYCDCYAGLVKQTGGYCKCYGGTVIQSGGVCCCYSGTVIQSGGVCHPYGGSVIKKLTNEN